MTDRIHSCKHSPDGRHHLDRSGHCEHCGQHWELRYPTCVALLRGFGTNRPDAHLGAVESV